jgi:hypothetical protein
MFRVLGFGPTVHSYDVLYVGVVEHLRDDVTDLGEFAFLFFYVPQDLLMTRRRVIDILIKDERLNLP